MKTRLLPCLIVAAISLGTGARAQVRYRVYSSGVNFDPVRINGLGEIAGQDGSRSFVYSRRLGTKQIHGLYSDQVLAEDVNAAGQVVGCSYLSNGNQVAFLWDPFGGIQNLGIPYGPDAYGINDAGSIVGRYYHGNV